MGLNPTRSQLAKAQSILNNIFMAKSPFEKVRSLVERRKLFEALLSEQSEIVCKGEGETLFQFKPTALVGDIRVEGFMTGLENLPKQSSQVLGNFSVGADRYFLKAEFNVQKDEASFPLNSDVFKLQRRASMRLHIPSSLGIYLAVKELNGKAVYAIAHIADLSAGGARIFFSDLNSPIGATGSPQAPDFQVGDQFKGILHLSDKKSLELNATVKHIQPAVFMGQIVHHIGTEFIELTPAMKNKLLAMTMDLQQKLVFME